MLKNAIHRIRASLNGLQIVCRTKSVNFSYNLEYSRTGNLFEWVIKNSLPKHISLLKKASQAVHRQASKQFTQKTTIASLMALNLGSRLGIRCDM